jgi:hypothetical protein
MFDIYSMKARVYPVAILFFPLVIPGFFYSLYFQTLLHFVVSIGFVGGLIYLLSQLGRDQGKIKEESLWKSWGGAPTTQILTGNNRVIDTYTKLRYIRRLLELCPVNSPAVGNRNQIPEYDSEVYRAWTRFLISKTRDTKEFNLLFKENTSYGFRRNLWALKPIALSLLGVLFCVNYAASARGVASLSPVEFPVEFWYSSFGLILVLLFWMFVVTRKWVKIPAVSYALRLCESLDQLK